MSAHCLFCGGLLDTTARCEACRLQRVAKDEKRIGAPCPRCEGVHLGPFEIGPAVVQGCIRCHGMFVATSEWDALLDFTHDRPLPNEIVLGHVGTMAYAERISGNPYRETVRDADVDVPSRLDTSTLGRPVLCPVCRDKMERVEFANVPNVDVDVCALHGIWLDAGELVQVVAQARGSLALASPETEAKPDPFAEALLLLLRLFSRKP